MRRVSIGAAVLIAGASVLIAEACSSSSSDSNPIRGDTDATTITPEFCTNLCNSEANSGTLTGTFSQCMSSCCEAHPGGCMSMDSGPFNGGDSGVPPVDSGSQPPDSGGQPIDGGDGGGPTDGGMARDGSGEDGGCATPCNGHCCSSAQACSNNTCVSTCTTASDCSGTGCCAPLTNAAGDPLGPYICKPNDGNAYDCCDGLFTDCSGNYCCVTDSNSNEFCALPCTTSSMCTPGHCDNFDFGTFTTTCSGPTACGP
jgi:hypothetical protein